MKKKANGTVAEEAQAVGVVDLSDLVQPMTTIWAEIRGLPPGLLMNDISSRDAEGLFAPGATRVKGAPSDPVGESIKKLIQTDGRYWVKPVWFKMGIAITAYHHISPKIGGKMKNIFVTGTEDRDKVYLDTPGWEPNFALGRVGSGKQRVAKPTYRPLFKEWKCTVELAWSSNHFGIKHVAKALMDMGMYNGIGDWRPQKNGEFGRFEVVSVAVRIKGDKR